MRTKSGQPVELDKGDLAAAADEGVGVHAAPVYVAVVSWDAHVIKQVRHLQHISGSESILTLVPSLPPALKADPIGHVWC